MKAIKKIQLFVVLCLSMINIKAQVKRNSNNFIEVKVRALLNDKYTKNYSVSVYLDGLRIDSMYNNSKRALYVDLELNKIYSLHYQKSNCADKIVIINTTLPSDLDLLEDENRYFEIEMSDGLLKKTSETVDLPVAILVIDKIEKLLVVSETYHAFMHHNQGFYNVIDEQTVLTTKSN